MEFLLINGKVVSKSEANLTNFVWNEPFIISQKVWFGFGGIPLFNENLKAIEAQFDSFKVALPALFKNKRELFRLTKRMLNKNKFYRSGYITYQFFITNDEVNYIASSQAFSTFDFPFHETGLLVNFSLVKKSSVYNLGALKCHNRHLWKAAKAASKSSAFNNAILLNENEKICEGIGTNIFMIKKAVLITPSLTTGCYNGVLRNIILQHAKALNLKVIEVPEIAKEHLFEMEEVFFASEEYGIQWVLGIDKKRFVHEYSENIYFELNNYLKEKIAD